MDNPLTLCMPVELPLPIIEFADKCEEFESTIRAELGDRVSNFRLQGGGSKGPTLFMFDLALSEPSAGSQGGGV